MLIGIGTDGAAANVAIGGLKGLVEGNFLGCTRVGALPIALRWQSRMS